MPIYLERNLDRKKKVLKIIKKIIFKADTIAIDIYTV